MPLPFPHPDSPLDIQQHHLQQEKQEDGKGGIDPHRYEDVGVDQPAAKEGSYVAPCPMASFFEGHEEIFLQSPLHLSIPSQSPKLAE